MQGPEENIPAGDRRDPSGRPPAWEDKRMITRGTMVFVVCMLFALVASLSGQKEPHRPPQISVLGTRTLFVAELWLRSSNDPLFVPYCGTGESGRKFLCTRGTHLEKKTPEGWRKAEVRGAASLGGSSLLSVPGQLIPPRDRGSFRGCFTFIFDPDIFGIPPGARLRIVVDIWQSEESLESGAAPAQVTSPEFVYPGE